MKKTLYVLSAALLIAGACTQFKEDGKRDFDPTAAPTITISDIQDNSFKATISPADGNLYYTYAVIEGTSKADAESVLEGGLKNDCIKILVPDDEGTEVEVPLAGTVSVKDSASVSIHAYGLKTGTTYTVYAVANNADGKVSRLVGANVTTYDSSDPNVKDFGLESDGVFTITFDDPVQLTNKAKEGIVTMTAHYFGVNAFDRSGNLLEIISETIPTDSLSTNGKVLRVGLPTQIPGALVFLTYEEGLVKNSTSHEIPAYTTMQAAITSSGLSTKGICDRFETENFDFYQPWVKEENTGEAVRLPADSTLYFNNWSSLVMTAVADSIVTPSINQLFDAEPAIEIRTTSGKLRVISYPATNFEVITPPGNTVGIMLDEAPQYGSYVGFTVAEGSFQDIWGNPNNEFSTIDLEDEEAPVYGNWFFSYGYSLDDITGVYYYSGKSYWAGYDESGYWVIEPAEEGKLGNVKLTTIWDITCDYPVYCYFDTDSGVLTIPDWAPFYDYVSYQWLDDYSDVVYDEDGNPVIVDYGTLYTAVNGEDYVTFNVPQPGVLTSPSAWFGYYGESEVSADNNGWWNLFTQLGIERVSTEIPAPSAAPASVGIKKAPKAHTVHKDLKR